MGQWIALLNDIHDLYEEIDGWEHEDRQVVSAALRGIELTIGDSERSYTRIRWDVAQLRERRQT